MSKIEKTIPVKNCIRWLEASLFHDRWIMSPSVISLIEATIKHLKLIEEKEKNIDAK